MTIQINSRTFDELSNTIQELETLTSKLGNLSSKESARNYFLLAKLALLKSGVSVNEVRNFETERLRKEAGLPQNVALRSDPDRTTRCGLSCFTAKRGGAN